MRSFIYSIVTMLLTVLITSSEAITRKVPQDYPKIQLAINAAVNGDTVLVAEGTYTENIVLSKKIVLASLFITDGDTSHISRTIIDGGSPSHPDSASVIAMFGGTDSTTVITGFTIRNGHGTKLDLPGPNDWISGGGILIFTGGATITHNNITLNTLTSSLGVYGGGIAIDPNPGPILYWVIEHNNISSNIITSTAASTAGLGAEGAGVWLSGNGRFMDNIVAENVATSKSTYSSGGGMQIGSTSTVLVANNIVRGNKAAYGGGFWMGAYSQTTRPSITLYNNIIVGNAGISGSAMNIESGDFILMNNTIVDNLGQNAIASSNTRGPLTFKLLNNILWNSTARIELSGGGSVYASNNCVRGGCAGTGNIDADPLFVPDDSLYHLSDSSYCIARGSVSSFLYNILLHAPLLDYTGSPRPQPKETPPDIGAIEHAIGVPRNPLPQPIFLMGSKFQIFYDSVLKANQSNRMAIVDSFFTANPVMPFIEDTLVHFLYRGSANSVNVAGDFNDWTVAGDPLALIAGTDLWYKVMQFEKDARFDYKFVLNGSTWILDPKNPKTTPGGFGDNSTMNMPQYPDAPELEYDPNIAHGTITDTTFTSTFLGNSRKISVYTPAEYDQNSGTTYSVALFHDGSEWISFAKVKNTLDYLIAKKRIQPLIAVFVSPLNSTVRIDEYFGVLRQAFCNFITSEIMPYIKSRYKTIDNAEHRASLGVSAGSGLSLWLGYNYSTTFGKVGAFSGVGQAEIDAFSGSKKPLDIYLDAGTYEENSGARTLHSILINKGYNHVYKEWHEGHSWGNWRAHLDNALEFLFPGSALSVEHTVKIATEFSLSQNYPNPFNPTTTISYQLPVNSKVSLKIYDLLGREVATLVNEEQSAGWKKVEWNAASVSTGIYFYKLQANNFVETKKMLVIK